MQIVVEKKWTFAVIFSALIILEMCFNVYFHKGTFGQSVCAFGLFGVSIATGLFIIFTFYNKSVVVENDERVKKSLFATSLLVWLVGLTVVSYFLHKLWLRIPIDPGNSDIIPTLEIAVKRFLNGEFPYQKISKWGYDLPLTYLPMQWGPYILPEVLHIDYRWITIIISGLAGIWLIRRASLANTKFALFVPLLLLLNWAMLLKNDEGILANTIEVMVAGYYMMFIMGLAGKNSIVKGIVIGVCLMSRYSLVLWLPLWVFVEWVSGSRKSLIIALSTVFVFVCCVYVIPFLSKDWNIFSDGYHYYTQAALGEWNHLNDQGQPYHLYNGNGFAYLFYERHSYSLEDRLKSLQKFHLIICISFVISMAAWYWFHRKKINAKIFIMGSFKIYLSIFLAFIQVPYSYLMLTGGFVSIAIFAELLRYKSDSLHNAATLTTKNIFEKIRTNPEI